MDGVVWVKWNSQNHCVTCEAEIQKLEKGFTLPSSQRSIKAQPY